MIPVFDGLVCGATVLTFDHPSLHFVLAVLLRFYCILLLHFVQDSQRLLLLLYVLVILAQLPLDCSICLHLSLR